MAISKLHIAICTLDIALSKVHIRICTLAIVISTFIYALITVAVRMYNGNMAIANRDIDLANAAIAMPWLGLAIAFLLTGNPTSVELS